MPEVAKCVSRVPKAESGAGLFVVHAAGAQVTGP